LSLPKIGAGRGHALLYSSREREEASWEGGGREQGVGEDCWLISIYLEGLFAKLFEDTWHARRRCAPAQA